jgi:hypothetical protein
MTPGKQIVLTFGQDGRLNVSVHGVDAMTALQMLMDAQRACVQQLAAAQAKEPQPPPILLARGSLPPVNGVG